MKTADFADFFKTDLKSPSWLFSSKETHSKSFRKCQPYIQRAVKLFSVRVSVVFLRLFLSFRPHALESTILGHKY